MSTRFFLPLLFHLALATTGCSSTFYTAVQALPNKAYVIGTNSAGSQVYNCFDAPGGPTCVPVVEEALK